MMAQDEHKNKKPRGKKLLGMALAFLTVPLSGCFSMYAPGTMNENQIQVRQHSIIEDVPYDGMSESYLDSLAAHYAKHGDGPMDLLLTYDPKSVGNTAMNATKKVAMLAASLRDRGVNKLESNIMPVRDQGEEARVLINYTAFTAHAPKGCDSMLPGLNGTALEDEKGYQMGCSIKSLMVKQVANPSDLAGKGNVDMDTDGRSASNIIEAYRSGAPNAELSGEDASNSE